jgi:DNA helicase II / ATP-dependent DNA helicase PcrA
MIKMTNNKLIIAAAGSGKTTFLVNEALKQSGDILITTFTEANEAEIKNKIIQLKKCIPSNITIQTWFSFLLQHGVRPYQDSVNIDLYEKNIGFFLTERQSGFRYKTKSGFPVYFGEEDYPNYYFTKDFKLYSDKISKFVFESNKKTKGEVINRISKIYQHIFIDEVQDLAGWDLEVLSLLFDSSSKILLVGDPRQVTYLTHHPKKYAKYKDGKILEFIKQECKKNICCIDITNLNKTHRNNKEICDYSSKLFPSFEKCEPCNCDNCRNQISEHEGIFFVKEQDIDKYCKKYSPTILKYQSASYPEWTYGKSKGLTFDRVLIYPTEPILKWIKNNKSELPSTSRSKFYVALTRSKHSVAIVYNYDDREDFDGIVKWSDTE